MFKLLEKVQSRHPEHIPVDLEVERFTAYRGPVDEVLTLRHRMHLTVIVIKVVIVRKKTSMEIIVGEQLTGPRRRRH